MKSLKNHVFVLHIGNVRGENQEYHIACFRRGEVQATLDLRKWIKYWNFLEGNPPIYLPPNIYILTEVRRAWGGGGGEEAGKWGIFPARIFQS
jgi:hypothetical protein